MQEQRKLQQSRIVASVAATAIALACGTNYVYSAWAPQFADRLKLSTTQSNLIGVAGNMGMYTVGVPLGMLIDNRGPKSAVGLGAFLLGLGYYGLYQAFESSYNSMPFLILCSYLTGVGGCSAFVAAIKTSALNWPHHRGTATGFPLAAFGLSAFFFSMCGSVLFPGDPGAFLGTLTIGSFVLVSIGFFFLRIVPSNDYTVIADESGVIDTEILRPSSPANLNEIVDEASIPTSSCQSQDFKISIPDSIDPGSASGERRSLLLDPRLSEEFLAEHDDIVERVTNLHPDFRGMQLLRRIEFWHLFSAMGLLTGVGLMSINNIGHDSTALWRKWNPSVSDEFLLTRQQMHVSILSVCNFLGRLISGLGSDYLVRVLEANRLWCLIAAGLVFALAQILAVNIENPALLVSVSGLSGLGYGIMYGVLPSITAELFGVHGLSTNWGMMTLSAVLSGYVFNVFYGFVFDGRSVAGPQGELTCQDGLDCYKDAYIMTSIASLLGTVGTLWIIHHQYSTRGPIAQKL